jgi:hypothetical protein
MHNIKEKKVDLYDSIIADGSEGMKFPGNYSISSQNASFSLNKSLLQQNFAHLNQENLHNSREY